MAEELAGPSFYSYNLTDTSPILSVDDLIYTTTPDDLPLRLGIGGLGVPIVPRRPVNTTIFYWMEEDVPLPRGTLNEDLDTSETGIDVATGHAVRFAVGDGIRIDDEVMIVTAIDTATEILTVTRGSASLTNSTAATHTNGAEIIGLGTILIEGAIGVANFQGRDRFSNYTQIFSKKITSSRTARKIPKYGVPDELVRQTMHATQNLNLGIENAAVYGIPHLVTATNRRQTGGLDNYITTNEDSTSDWLTVDVIEAMQSAAYEEGNSRPWVILAQPGAFAALNNIAGNERVTQVDVSSPMRGRQMATTVMTEFGTTTLARDRWIKDNEAFAIPVGGLVEMVFQPLVVQPLAKTDDTDSFMMVTELGYEVKGESHMAKFTGLDKTSALPASGLV